MQMSSIHRLVQIIGCQKRPSLQSLFHQQHAWAFWKLHTGHGPRTLKHWTPYEVTIHDMRKDIFEIYHKAIQSVLPDHMVTRALKVENNTLTVDGQSYQLNKNVHIFAFGKAVTGMVRAAEEQLGDHIVGGIASIPPGTVEQFKKANKLDLLPKPDSKVELIEGARYNIPDEKSMGAAKKVFEACKALGAGDIALMLISGGGSTLLTLPVEPITLEEMNHVTQTLFSHGAPIDKVNTVRKQLEVTKGGGLARVTYPAQVISLILSDIIDNPVPDIASGPTCQSYATPQQCLDILTTYKVDFQSLPESVKYVLQDRAAKYEEMKKKRLGSSVSDDDSHELKESQEQLQSLELAMAWDCRNAQNVLVGSNIIMVEAAMSYAANLGYLPYVLSTRLHGEAVKCGETLAQITTFLSYCMGQKTSKDKQAELVQREIKLVSAGVPKKVVNDLRKLVERCMNTGKPMCVIGAGETVVNVTGKGVGGRCMEMGLAYAMSIHQEIYCQPKLQRLVKVQFLSAATDGNDGPCDAAGVIVCKETISEAVAQGLDVVQALTDNDTYPFFTSLNAGDNMIDTGLTGTNVMDIQLLLIEPDIWRVSRLKATVPSSCRPVDPTATAVQSQAM